MIHIYNIASFNAEEISYLLTSHFFININYFKLIFVLFKKFGGCNCRIVKVWKELSIEMDELSQA